MEGSEAQDINLLNVQEDKIELENNRSIFSAQTRLQKLSGFSCCQILSFIHSYFSSSGVENFNSLTEKDSFTP